MNYKGLYIKTTLCSDLQREDNNGNIVICKGFNVEIFTDESEETEIDIFSAAVGHEILNTSPDEIEQFVQLFFVLSHTLSIYNMDKSKPVSHSC